MIELRTGDVVWTALGPGRGREQIGHRPVLVVVSPEYLLVVDTLAIVLPVTTRDHGGSNHIPLTVPTGLASASWAIPEQPLTLSREWMTRHSGHVDDACMARIRTYLRDFMDL